MNTAVAAPKVSLNSPTFNNQQTVAIPSNLVDNGARTKITHLLADTFGVTPPADYVTPDFWDWTTKRGNFTKRLNKWLKSHGHKASNDFLGTVGSIAGLSVTETHTYTFDFDRRITWRAGDFGDHGSCFTSRGGSNSAAVDMIRDNGGFALRFYNEEGKGIARSWVAPHEGLHVVFNGYNRTSASGDYAPADGLSTLAQARILAHITGGTYRKVSVCNNGDEDGTLYTNSGNGYLIGDFDAIEAAPDWVDFEWEDEGRYSCEACGERLSEDEARTDDNGHTYCDHCYGERYAYCDACYNECDREASHYVDGRTYCDDCFCDRYFSCDRCGDDTSNDEANDPEQNGSPICDDCFGRYYATCKECDEATEIRFAEATNGGEYLCPECAREHYDVCAHCNDWTRDDEATTFDGLPYCEACASLRFYECDACGQVTLRGDNEADATTCPTCAKVAQEIKAQEDAGQTTFAFPCLPPAPLALVPVSNETRDALRLHLSGDMIAIPLDLPRAV